MAKHKPELSDEENVQAFSSYTPGYPYRPDIDMAKHIPDSCPNKAKASNRFMIDGSLFPDSLRSIWHRKSIVLFCLQLSVGATNAKIY